MRTPKCRMGAMLMIVGTCWACGSMSVNEKAVLSEPIAPRSDQECDVRYFSPIAPVLEHCKVLVQLGLQDSGFTRTSRCGTAGMRSSIQRVACEYGANAATIKRISSTMSTCVSAEATLYRCDEDVLLPRSRGHEDAEPASESTR